MLISQRRGEPRAFLSLLPASLSLLLLGGLIGCGDDDDTAFREPDSGKQEQRDDDTAGHGGQEDPGDPDPGDKDPDDGDDDDAKDDDDTKDDDAKDDDDTKDDDDDSDEQPSSPLTDAGMPEVFGGMVVDTAPSKQDLDLFGEPGHRIWLEVTKAQLEHVNAGDNTEDIYSLPTFASHVVVQDAKTGSVADYGQMEIKLVGESTYRSWDSTHIPNIRIDTDEFQKKRRIGGFEHFRLNNALVGSIFREHIAHEIFHALGYPALKSTYAMLGSNVWGEGTWVPMTLIEMYKLRFCDDNEKLLGGTCTNMWEFPGQVGGGGGGGGGPIFDGIGAQNVWLPDNACQVKQCDNTRLEELIVKLDSTEPGPGFMDELDEYVDWDKYHQFQCLDWMLWIGDDPLHNGGNNNLIIERDDGRMVWAPYSVDISAGQDWYQNTPLLGQTALALGCQSDPECWDDTVAACETLIKKFDKLNPEKLVDEAEETLSDLDMLRKGDDLRAKEIRAWYVQRQRDLPNELERYRYIPNVDGHCPNDLQQCNDGGCGTEQQCAERICSIGTEWCESYQSCISPQYDQCPVCSDPNTPYYCQYGGLCVASLTECSQYCPYDYVYCPSYGGCVPYYYCSDVDSGVPDYDDAGVGSGGMGAAGGGMAGFMIAEPPILK